MVKKKKVILFSLAILGFAAATLFYVYDLKFNTPIKRINIQASVIVFTNSEDLINDCDLVVVASPIDEFEDREPVINSYSSGDIMSFHTNTNIIISKILKNITELDLKEASTMTIVEPIVLHTNALGEKQVLTIEDYKEMDANKEYLMFIQSALPGMYGIKNLNNGKFELNSSYDAAKSSQEETDPVHTQLKNDLFARFGLKK